MSFYNMYPMEYGQLVTADPRNAVDPIVDVCGWCEVIVYWDDTSQVIIDRHCSDHGYLIDWEQNAG